MEGRQRSNTVKSGLLSGFSLVDEKLEPDKCPDDQIEGRRPNLGQVGLAQMAKTVAAGYFGVMQLTKAKSMLEQSPLSKIAEDDGYQDRSMGEFKDIPSLATRPTHTLTNESANTSRIDDFLIVGDELDATQEAYEPNLQSKLQVEIRYMFSGR